MSKTSKYLLMIGIYLFLSLLFLIGIECGLRAFGYGVDLDHLFLQTANGKYLYLNKNISRRYFTQSQATNGNVEFFRKKKQKNTFRIFVLGESAAMGFPYPNNISFQRMLKYQLQKTNPDKDIEIINLALTAINSYTFYDFAQELVHFEPDAIFIYGGHNEYYGALGVGSNNTLGSHPTFIRWAIRLRQLRLTQWLDSLKSHLSPQKEFSDNLMKYVVKEQVIPYKSKLFQQGLEQFQNNMKLVLNLFKKHQIPVFFSTVGVNLKDLKPFKDDDNIYLVNTEEEFNRKSPFGIPGRELLLEHVHPTIEGHRVIANCFLEVLRQNQSCFSNKKLQIGTSEDLYNFPVLEFDSLAGEYACLQLRKGFPFYEKDLSTITPKTEVEKIAANYVRQKNWYQSMDQLYQYALNSKNYVWIFSGFVSRITLTTSPSLVKEENSQRSEKNIL